MHRGGSSTSLLFGTVATSPVALIVRFTTNGMCAKNKNIYAWREQAIIREIATQDLYCCLLSLCEALRTCRSGFPIATVQTLFGQFMQFLPTTLAFHFPR